MLTLALNLKSPSKLVWTFIFSQMEGVLTMKVWYKSKAKKTHMHTHTPTHTHEEYVTSNKSARNHEPNSQ